MKTPVRGDRAKRVRGFTLVELLTALVIFSLLALMSYRGLGAVLETRRHVAAEAVKWRSVAAFLARFEHDVQLAARRDVRSTAGPAPAFRGREDAAPGPRLEFSRLGAREDLGVGADTPRRVGYGYNARREIELWLWPALDVSADSPPVRHRVLQEVSEFDVHYLGADLAWTGTWPQAGSALVLPLAVRLRIVLASGEEIVRVFALAS